MSKLVFFPGVGVGAVLYFFSILYFVLVSSAMPGIGIGAFFYFPAVLLEAPGTGRHRTGPDEVPAAAGHGFCPPVVQCESQAPPGLLDGLFPKLGLFYSI